MDSTPINLLERQSAMDFAQGRVGVRRQHELTQQALADSIGIRVTRICRYEADTNILTLNVIRALIEGSLARHQTRRLSVN
jgi:hypothetical protein